MRQNKQIALLLLGVVVALLPTIILRDFTPSNELRYLSIADEALRNHSLFAFSDHGIPYADKPPLYLWIVMACRLLTGAHRMWLLSMFSLLPALGIVAVMRRWTRTEMDGTSSTLAAMMLLSSGLFVVCALTIRMDMLMCLFIVLAMREFWRMYSQEKGSGRSRWLFPVYLFLAVFTKGPLGLAIPLVCTTIFLLISKQIRQWPRYWGWRTWSVLLLGAGLWVGAAWAEGGIDYVNNLFFHQTVGRTFHAFHHQAPFYYYAVCVWYCLAPWSPVVIGLIVAALNRHVVRSDLQRFFLTVSISTFVLLSCVSSKIQIYLLPAIPFMVYSAAMFLPRYAERKWVKALILLPAGILVMSLPAIIIVAHKTGLPYLHNGIVVAAAALLSVGALAACHILLRDSAHSIWRTVSCLSKGILATCFVAAFAFPSINDYIGYGALCRHALILSRQSGISDFRTWRLHRSSGIDVYLHQDAQTIEKDSTPQTRQSRPFLLLTKQSCLPHLRYSRAITCGPNAVVVCPGETKTCFTAIVTTKPIVIPSSAPQSTSPR